jgi:hypothetical protein
MHMSSCRSPVSLSNTLLLSLSHATFGLTSLGNVSIRRGSAGSKRLAAHWPLHSRVADKCLPINKLAKQASLEIPANRTNGGLMLMAKQLRASFLERFRPRRLL